MAPQEGWSKLILALQSMRIHPVPPFLTCPCRAAHQQPSLPQCPGIVATAASWSHCSANPLTQNLLLCLMYPELLEEGLMFAFLGRFLMPAPLTLGRLLKGRTAGREGHTVEGKLLRNMEWHKAGGETRPAQHSPGMVVGRARQDPLHSFSLADQGTSKTKPELRETKRLQKNPMENVFARVTLLWPEVAEWYVQTGRWSPFLFAQFAQLATWAAWRPLLQHCA